MSRLQDVRAALSALNHRDPTNWLSDGRPDAEIVSAIAGFPIEQRELGKFNLFRRKFPAAESVTITPPKPQLSPGEAVVAIEVATKACEASRAEIVRLTAAVKVARAKFAAARSEYENGKPRITRDDLMRDFCKSEQTMRRAGITPSTGVPGPSALDRQRFYGRGGSADTGYNGPRPTVGVDGKVTPSFPARLKGAYIAAADQRLRTEVE